VLIAVLAPVLAPHGINTIDDSRILAGPNLTHPFGYDDLGRDVLSRVLYACRVSLGISIGSVLLAMAVGVPVGVLAGYVGGWTDLLLMRGIDLLLASPLCCLRSR
jgi:peptide/nickel transport system permease protein